MTTKTELLKALVSGDPGMLIKEVNKAADRLEALEGAVERLLQDGGDLLPPHYRKRLEEVFKQGLDKL